MVHFANIWIVLGGARREVRANLGDLLPLGSVHDNIGVSLRKDWPIDIEAWLGLGLPSPDHGR